MGLGPLLAMLLAATQQLPQLPVVRGAVRAGVSGDPVVGALVRVVGGNVHTYSDSGGAYVLALPSGGVHRVRFSRTGYESLTLDVIVGADTARLDVALDPVALQLAPTAVVA